MSTRFKSANGKFPSLHTYTTVIKNFISFITIIMSDNLLWVTFFINLYSVYTSLFYFYAT